VRPRLPVVHPRRGVHAGDRAEGARVEGRTRGSDERAPGWGSRTGIGKERRSCTARRVVGHPELNADLSSVPVHWDDASTLLCKSSGRCGCPSRAVRDEVVAAVGWCSPGVLGANLNARSAHRRRGLVMPNTFGVERVARYFERVARLSLNINYVSRLVSERARPLNLQVPARSCWAQPKVISLSLPGCIYESAH